MKYGWRLLFIPLWVFCVAGATLTLSIVIGWYAWEAFLAAGIAGLVLGIPGGLWNTFKVRRDDPAWEGSCQR